MKICFIVPKAYPLLNNKFSERPYGGAEVHIVALARELVKKVNIEVFIVTAIYGENFLVEKFNGINVVQAIPLNGGITYKIRKIFGLLKILKKINADFYIQRALNPFTVILASLVKLGRKKFVYMIASDAEVDGTNYMYKKVYLKPLISLSFKLSSLVVCQNEFEQQSLIRKFGVKDSVLLRKSMDTKDFRFNKKCKYDGIWIGRTTPRKRTDLFINLVKDNPDKKFLMLCIAALETEEFTDNVREAGEEYSNLKVLFSVEHEKVSEYIQESKMHILTSEVEGDLSMTTLEASQWSLPTLSMYLDHDLLYKEFNGGVYCKGSYEVLLKEFRKVSKDEEYRLELSKGAHQLIEKYYNMDKNIDKMVKVLKDI